MTGQYIVQGIFALAGIISLLASLLNWNRNAQTIVRNVGRNRARLFYGILGVILIGMAIFFFVETQKAIAIAVTSSPSTY
jgi:small neutral amino acid transporter SnatA (MarC family)